MVSNLLSIKPWNLEIFIGTIQTKTEENDEKSMNSDSESSDMSLVKSLTLPEVQLPVNIHWGIVLDGF